MQEKFQICNANNSGAYRTVFFFYHIAIYKLTNFLVQDRLEVCLTLSEVRTVGGSVWLKEQSTDWF